MCAVRRACASLVRATCASGLLHCATTSCTIGSHLSFCSGCARATMDQQLQQLQQLLQLLQASGSGTAGASSRPVQASGSGSQASSSSGVTTPEKPQVNEQPSNQPTEQPSPPRLQPHFPCKSELLVHHSCHIDSLLADDSLEWRWLCNYEAKRHSPTCFGMQPNHGGCLLCCYTGYLGIFSSFLV